MKSWRSQYQNICTAVYLNSDSFVLMEMSEEYYINRVEEVNMYNLRNQSIKFIDILW